MPPIGLVLCEYNIIVWVHTFTLQPTAPSLAHSHPPPGPVYQTPQSTLSLEASIVGLRISDVEWRHNQLSLTPSVSTEMRGSHDHTWAELHIAEFDPEVHGGSYELLVANPAGRTVVATWNIEQACESYILLLHCLYQNMCTCACLCTCICIHTYALSVECIIMCDWYIVRG